MQYFFSVAILYINKGGILVLRQQRGNFLVQALLVLALIFAFVPFLSQQIASRNIDSRMHSSVRQIELAQTAARIFIRENASNIPFDTTVVAGNKFSDLLEPYGLPLGYVPRTALGQDIALVMFRSPASVSAYLEVTGGDLSDLERAELIRRIGFYALDSDGAINVGIELQDIYSDIVRRDEPVTENSAFLTDLDMGGFSLDNVGNLFANIGDIESAQIDTVSVIGTESGKKERNNIADMAADKAVFQTKTGEAALSLTRGTLFAKSFQTRTVSQFGDSGNFTAFGISVNDFTMTAGRVSFTGPAKWNIRGSVVTNNISFSTERLDIASYLETTRGQDVYIDEESLEYSTKSGIEVGTMYVSNITVRDQISSVLNTGTSAAVILDIRPAGASLLPDVYVADVNNDAFSIIKDAASAGGDTENCKDIISALDGVYNKQSLAQNLICQYVYWQRLEKRIDIKQCLMAGRSDCF